MTKTNVPQKNLFMLPYRIDRSGGRGSDFYSPHFLLTHADASQDCCRLPDQNASAKIKNHFKRRRLDSGKITFGKTYLK